MLAVRDNFSLESGEFLASLFFSRCNLQKISERAYKPDSVGACFHAP